VARQLHQPMWYMWSKWERVHELLARHHTKAVIAGHFHYNQIDAHIDGISYRVVGATGGETKDGSPNAGDLQHVSVLAIDEAGHTDFKIYSLGSTPHVTWTRREIMDRVEAHDDMLGGVGQLEIGSPVYAHDGVLASSCSGTDPATLTLAKMGNADASPVDIAIVVDAPGIEANGAFGAGMCLSQDDATHCKLKGSAGVAVSNTSIVEAPTYPPLPPPLWTASLKSSGTLPAQGTAVKVTASISFVADNQIFVVRRSGAAIIKACGG
jgi:hypothetical protein